MPGRRDLDDLDRYFDRDEAAERASRRDEDRAASTKRLEEENRQDAAIRSRAIEHTKRSNEQSILREYRAVGVDPMRVGGKGQLVSLALLKSVGWTIRDDGQGGRVLVQPPPPQKPEPREELGR